MSTASTTPPRDPDEGGVDEPPTGPIPKYTIDLSLPPRDRYKTMSAAFAPKMRALTTLFDEILAWSIPFKYPRLLVKYLSSRLLTKLHDPEQNEEIQGVAEVSGVDLFLVVALNVLLDSLLGCTSGGVRVRGKRDRRGGEVVGMMHFRTLDWGMDGLRHLLVELDFVRSESDEPEKVIARSITYAGFVGVLTGVRPGLSLSLNFRPIRSCSSLSLRYHQLLVLLGHRPSIASHLRSVLFSPSSSSSSSSTSLSTPSPTTALTSITSSPCYLILCSPSLTTAIERDLHTSTIRTSSTFLVQTNHDQDLPSSALTSQTERTIPLGGAMWIEDSEDRANCVASKWEAVARKQIHARVSEAKEEEPFQPSIVEKTLAKWVRAYPTFNETSHFGCVMDPTTGTIRLLARDGDK
ncbi:beta subunit of N-acylethanolamine-hydrolyzing acid amidase-domain-containing protein [Amylocarpus encephaloides]|uniref:ceramidase n=1 Tax=Amylocarpus encephaloides TaxID=45428 RepID=A0A9P7YJ69_9HELO|nr:beta subunit of N-acylethanolamine-hydrolyzing acid amidase-domain-containing protein [Amylocarpus encephaloides]